MKGNIVCCIYCSRLGCWQDHQPDQAHCHLCWLRSRHSRPAIVTYSMYCTVLGLWSLYSVQLWLVMVTYSIRIMVSVPCTSLASYVYSHLCTVLGLWSLYPVQLWPAMVPCSIRIMVSIPRRALASIGHL